MTESEVLFVDDEEHLRLAAAQSRIPGIDATTRLRRALDIDP